MARRIMAGTLVLLLFSCAAGIKRKEWIQAAASGYPLLARAQIIRDQYGVPHIRAQNDPDLFFALGYAMAQDRFFQMDLIRRAGRGELCQFFGRIRLTLPVFGSIDLLNADKLMRALNYKGRAESGYADMPAEAKTLLKAFSAGVNRYLQDAGDSIPVYHFMRTHPHPWRPEDSLVCADIFGLAMTYGQFGTEYYYTRFLRELPPDKMKYLLPQYPAGAPVVVKDVPVAGAEGGLEKMLASFRLLLGVSRGLGSNNWAVAPEKSASGAAIICNDPHVPVYPMPSFWYHVQLEGKSFNVIGMMFPGLPAFGAAYNKDLAWALTNASIDAMDIFIEKINPQNPGQYLYKGEWKNFAVRKEEIPLKGKSSFRFEVRESVHGPVIDPGITGYYFPSGGPDQVYAVKLVEVELGKFLQGYLDMARAKNWDDWVQGLKNMYRGPVGWNHVFADRDGNIGYWLTGHVPVRPDQQGEMARQGWTGEQDWQGYLPLEDLPHVFNPQQKYIATANNKNFPDNYPYYLGSEYYSDRITRIDEVLRSKEKFSIADMQKLQLDTTVVWARTFVPVFLEDLEACRDQRAQKAVKVFRQWQKNGYVAGLDSIGASLYEVARNNLEEFTFGDEMGGHFFGVALYGVTMWSLERIIIDPENPWFDDVKTPQRETRQDLTRRAAIEAVKYLEKKLGKNPAAWQWGKISHSYFYTPFGFLPGGYKHRIGKFPREGMSGTVNANEGTFLGPFGHIFVVGPTTRMIVDFADPGHFHFTTTTGNSENLKSGRSGNLTEFWVQGKYLTLSMQPEEYEKNAMGTLELNP